MSTIRGIRELCGKTRNELVGVEVVVWLLEITRQEVDEEMRRQLFEGRGGRREEGSGRSRVRRVIAR